MDQREGIRNFLSNLIIRFTLDEALFRKENTFVNKLNLILVQVRVDFILSLICRYVYLGSVKCM